jgi:hypothetical protein
MELGASVEKVSASDWHDISNAGFCQISRTLGTVTGSDQRTA